MPASSKELARKSKGRLIKTAQKVSQKSQHSSEDTALPSVEISPDLQQLALDSFWHGFGPDYSRLLQDVQQVKHYLYERDFPNAFGKETLREAYALRWSPTRALAYASVFYSIDPLNLKEVSVSRTQTNGEAQDGIKRAVRSTNDVVCMGGGGGAELVGLAAYLHHATYIERPDSEVSGHNHRSLSCTIIDLADWSSVIQKLLTLVNSEPSQNAQSDVRSALCSPNLTAKLRQQDVLEFTEKDMVAQYQGVKLVTIMFTLNELYSTSISKTTRLLLNLSNVLDEGALLLVVDSPGSYSTVNIGRDGQEKKYPMQFLLDHTLLDSAADTPVDGKEKIARWKKFEGIESRWFRLAKGVRYPIGLEDMRYQLHSYCRV